MLQLISSKVAAWNSIKARLQHEVPLINEAITQGKSNGESSIFYDKYLSRPTIILLLDAGYVVENLNMCDLKTKISWNPKINNNGIAFTYETVQDTNSIISQDNKNQTYISPKNTKRKKEIESINKIIEQESEKRFVYCYYNESISRTAKRLLVKSGYTLRNCNIPGEKTEINWNSEYNKLIENTVEIILLAEELNLRIVPIQ